MKNSEKKNTLQIQLTKRSCLHGVHQPHCWKAQSNTHGPEINSSWSYQALITAELISTETAVEAIHYTHDTVPAIVHHYICLFSPFCWFAGLLHIPVQLFSMTAWSGHLGAGPKPARCMGISYPDLFSKIHQSVSLANHEIFLENESCDTLIPPLGGQCQVDPFQKHCRACEWLSSHRSENLVFQQIHSLEEIPIKAINGEHAFHLAVGMWIEELGLNTKLTAHMSLRGLESIGTAHQDP